MQFAGIETQVGEKFGPAVKICSFDLKDKPVRGLTR
jgi:hypothetical protein